jgi:hypothetical protein
VEKMDIIYKGFIIKKGYCEWFIFNLNGQMLRGCKTKKECIKRIDEQTV